MRSALVQRSLSLPYSYRQTSRMPDRPPNRPSDPNVRPTANPADLPPGQPPTDKPARPPASFRLTLSYYFNLRQFLCPFISLYPCWSNLKLCYKDAGASALIEL